MFKFRPNSGQLIFMTGDKEIIRCEENGDIYVRGKLTENDKQVVDGLRELLAARRGA